MPIDFFIFRHGQTDWNRDRRLQGHTDIPLNEAGVSEAQCLEPKLLGLGPDVILTSTLSRAFETAKIVNQNLNAPMYSSDALKECQLGDAEGLLRSEIFQKFGRDMVDKWLSTEPSDINFAFPNGESKENHLKRLVSYLENFCKLHPEFKKIAVSTHGGCVRRFIHHCRNAPIEPPSIPNCVLYHIAYDPGLGDWEFHQQL